MIEKIETIEMNIGLHLEITDCKNKSVIVLRNDQNYKMPMPISFITNEDNDSDIEVRKSLDSEEFNFSILSANAGYGKSSFCSNMLKIWLDNKSETHSWMIKIVLSKIQFVSEDPNLMEIFVKSATGIDWKNWMLRALEEDIQKSKKVKLLLDGFDEIKDTILIDKFNKWIEKVPKETLIILTTRPYAVNKVKIPENRNLKFYVSLKEFTLEQFKQYISHYINAIIRDNRPNEMADIEKKNNLEEFILNYLNKTSTKHLGVPLETYLFCESMKNQILESLSLSTIEKLQEYLIAQNIEKHKNTVELFQRFIRTKLDLFLEKHFQIEYKGQHRLYALTSNYTDILMLFAYRQAFSLPYDVINRDWINKYQTKNMLTNELHDLGISSVETENINDQF